MSLTFCYSTEEAALNAAALEAWPSPLPKLKAWYESGELPLLHLPEREDDLNALEPLAAQWRAGASDLIVLGTGGSSLGAKALYALKHEGLGWLEARAGLKLHVLENVDPRPIAALMARLDPATTQILSISKSGNTAETLSQTLILVDWLRAALGEAALKEHVTLITEPKASALSALGERFGLRTLAHDPLVGGRFSVLSLVGLLPALALGLDARAIRKGAAQILSPALAGETQHEALLGAAWAVRHGRAGRSQAVLLPYADQLADMGLWFRQLWAESLGKDGQGTTPIRAMGTVDQHSQLQLYLDGPDDKTYSFVAWDARGQGPALPADLASGKLDYLAGHAIGDLLYAEARASADTLIAKGRPVRWAELGALDEMGFGQLFMHFILETLFAAEFMGVNAFDQPAVEAIKVRTREVL